MQWGGVMIVEDSVFNLLKEFWPDVPRLRRRKPNS
jgi:hypothetical protein